MPCSRVRSCALGVPKVASSDSIYAGTLDARTGNAVAMPVQPYPKKMLPSKNRAGNPYTKEKLPNVLYVQLKLMRVSTHQSTYGEPVVLGW